MSHKITMIIPCYFIDQSFIDMTKKCIDSIGPGIDQLLVIDDGSPVRSKLANVVRKVNGGYAAAVNTGLELASGDVIIVSNNDIEFVQPNWLEHLLAPLEQGFDISSIRTTDADGWNVEDCIEEGSKFGSIWAIKRKVYDTIGGLDVSFGKGYFEDLDFKKRAEDAAFRVGKNHAGLVEHRSKSTFRVVDPTDEAYHRALDRFKEKWGEVW